MKQEELDRNRTNRGESLAIIGIGCLFPQADDGTAYWATIREGVDSISEIPETHWHAADYFDKDPKKPDMTYGRRGGFLSPVQFNPMEYNIPPATLEAIDTSQLLGLVAADQALKDAGYGPGRDFDRGRVSVILGVTGATELVIPLGARLGHPRWREALREAGVDNATADDVVQRIADSYVPWQENSFPGLLGNVVAGRISKQFDLGGTNCVVDAACASSFSALHLAGLELTAGTADMVVTGGVDTFNDIFMYMCFSKTPALSPTGNAKPFDAAGDGTILGEGLGIVVIKRLADAERDGDRIYAVIRGVGSSSDGKGEAIYTPSPQGQKQAITNACRLAGVTPDTIGLVEAHGTGTKVGDAVEVSALRDIYGEAERPWCALGSVKSQIGHTKAAAGAAGLIKAALALHHKVIPPTIKVTKPLKEVVDGRTPFYIADRKRPWVNLTDHPRRAAVSAFGFGGSNFHTILEEYQPSRIKADWDGSVQILPLSGPDAGSLQPRLAEISSTRTWKEIRALAALLRREFDPTHPCRLVLVAERGRTDLQSLCKSAQGMLAANPAGGWSTPDGAFHGVGAVPGPLALLFPGQGSQYTGMLRDLACAFPEMLDALSAAELDFSSPSGRSLTDLIYPPAAFDDAERAAHEEALRSTDVAQPAIGAVSLGSLRLMESFGIEPAAVAGHSYGELTALCAAGRLDELSFHALSRLRGRLMAAGEGDRGSMLAVSAPLATVEALIAEEKLDLVIANRNAPSQAVLSGTTAEIERAAAACAARSLSCKRLPVAAAFHSGLVADAAEPFLAALGDLPFGSGQVPVYANSSACPYPDEAAAARELLARQLARPVEFVEMIEAIYSSGVRTFVEVGPGGRLTGLVRSILDRREHQAFALDASNGKRSGILDLARCLAQLAAAGYGVRLSRWDDAFQPEPAPASKKPVMTVPICGANYVSPRQKRPPRPTIGDQGPGAGDQYTGLRAQPTGTAPSLAPSPASPSAPSASRDALLESLRVTREGMTLLQRMQEETAQLHRRFLESQEAAGRTIQSLLQHQQQLLQGTVGDRGPVIQGPGTGDRNPATQNAGTGDWKPLTAAPASSGQTGERGNRVTGPRSPVPGPGTPANGVTATLLSVVSEKTGYPVEMLELGMGLDSDLGIDSIKRVEILSALQERLPDAPVIGPEQLGTLNTLGEIAAFLGDGGTGGRGNGVPGPGSPVPGPVASGSEVTGTLLAVVSEKTGYPVEMLELGMGLDSDLGIDSIKRVEILSALQERLPDAPVIGPEQLGTLNTLGEIAAFLGDGGTGGRGNGVPGPGSPVPGPVASGSEVTGALLAVVSEKTGYPVEMLELGMGLDSDLGIDSIKRVEILSALQERLPHAPVIGPEQLGSLNTLGEIASFLGDGSQGPGTGDPGPAANGTHVTETLLAVVSEKTGYPVEMLEPEMGLDSDLGIDSIKRVEILSALQERLPDAPVIGPEQLGTLNTLGEIAAFLGADSASRSPIPGPVVPGSQVPGPGTVKGQSPDGMQPLVRRTVVPTPLPPGEPLRVARGVILVVDDGSAFTANLCSALGAAGQDVRLVQAAPQEPPAEPVCGVVIPAPAAGTGDRFLEHAFLVIQGALPSLIRSARDGGAVLATVSRLDGAFGIESGTALADPLSGGLAGLVKTAARECPEISCKAIDLGEFDAPETAARAVADELLRRGPLEVGLRPGARLALTETLLPELSEPAAAPLHAGDVVLVTGGGRGVTAAAAVALATACRPFLVLVGRSPEPRTEPEWLASLTGESEIKRGILANAGEKLHPREIEQRYRAIEAGRELRATLDRIAAVGGRAAYCSVDIRNRAEVERLAETIRLNHGPIRGIVHGAGVLADRLIVDKTLEQFRQVFSTKVDGIRNLLEATRSDELTFIALFGSTTGRYGRSGQVDYAVANEVLNKLAQAESRRRPSCRTVCINWGPWDGGMVTPALKKVFAGEGIGLIGLDAGGELLVREIGAAGAPVEVTVLAETGHGAAPAEASRERALAEAYSLVLNVGDFPFIRSHVMDGRAVLPMAVIVEWLAHGALHGNPGFRFHGFNDLRICKGVVFEADSSCALQVHAGKARKQDSLFCVPVELVSTGGGRTMLHASAEIVLANRLPEGIRSIVDLHLDPYGPEGPVYDGKRLFHGPDLHGIEQVAGCSPKGISALVKGAPQPAAWLRRPLRSAWLTDPLALDCAFQLMILWSFERFGAGSLPAFAGRYRQFQESFPSDGVQVVIRVTAEQAHSATADMEFLDRATGKLVARLEGYQCVIDPSLQAAFRRNQLSQPGSVELEAA